MSNQKKLNRGFNIGVGIFVMILVVCAVYFGSQETSMCHQFRPHYYKAINGVVIKRYDCIVHGRRIGCVDLLNEDSIHYHFDWFHEWKVYKQLEPGDSVSKPSGSSNFEFYRKGEFLGGMYWNCEPPDTLSK
jgi:hypothetical protein